MTSGLQHFFSQSVFNVFGNATASFLAFLFNYVVVHALTQADYGEYASVNAYVTLLVLPLTVLALIITRSLARRAPARRWRALQRLNTRTLATLRHFLPAVLAGAVIAVFVLAWRANFLSQFSAPLVIFLLAANCLVTWWNSELVGLQWFRSTAAAAIASMGFRLLTGLAVLLWTPTLMGVYGCLVVSALVQCAWYYLTLSGCFRRKLTSTASLPAWSLTHLPKQAWLPSFLFTLTTTCLLNLDVVAVKCWCTPDFAGLYGLFSLFAKVLLYASQPLINVAFTHFGSSSVVHARQVATFASFFIIAFTLGMTALYAFLPGLLITIVGHASYLSLAPDLFLAAIFGGVYSLVMLWGQKLVAASSHWLAWGLLAPLAQLALFAVSPAQIRTLAVIDIAVTAALLIFWRLAARKASRA